MHNRTSKQRKSAQRRNAKFAALHATVEKMTAEVKKMKAAGMTVSPPAATRKVARG